MLIVRLARPASWRASWNAEIARALIADSGASPKWRCQDDRALGVELECSSRAVDALRRQVLDDRLGQPLPAVLGDAKCTMAGGLQQLTLPTLRCLEILGAEPLAVPPAIDGEVGPVLPSAFPEAHASSPPSGDVRSDEDQCLVSTTFARTKSSRSGVKYLTARPKRT